jgi:uncharacterized membrane protein
MGRSGEPGSLVGTHSRSTRGFVVPVPVLREWLPRPSDWRRDALRTTLWLVPALQVVGAGLLFVATYAIDRAAYRGDLTLPSWVNNGSADAARQILIGMAAAVITVVGLVFSITIVALTLASTQFGPRMLRNFIRDRGTQITLGTFVSTFVYAVLALGSVSHGHRGDFVPHLSITIALALVLADLGVLIYFIHHVATSIQLPQVIAGIARDLSNAVDAEVGGDRAASGATAAGPTPAEVLARIEEAGAVVAAPSSGYLQFVEYSALVDLATRAGSVVRLLYRPGHFVVEGLPLAHVWPPETAADVRRALERAHVTGAHRTLSQDLSFAIDQLVEIAIRALSPAVNDTFTAITCIDWLGDGLCKISAKWDPTRVHRDRQGEVRVIAAPMPYSRLVDRAFDKIRQAGRGMPAVLIRQLDALTKIADYSATTEQHTALARQAEMILRNSEESVADPDDRSDIAARYEAFLAAVR